MPFQIFIKILKMSFWIPVVSFVFIHPSSLQENYQTKGIFASIYYWLLSPKGILNSHEVIIEMLNVCEEKNEKYKLQK